MGVELIRHLLVVIDHHRILQSRIEPLRLVQNSLKIKTVCGRPLHRLSRTPGVVTLLWIGMAQTLHVLETEIAGPEIRELLKALTGEHYDIGIFRFLRWAKATRLHHQALGLSVAPHPVSIEA